MYKENSPWNKTTIINNTVLDIINKRILFADPNDEVYVIPQEYDERPDLCAVMRCMELQSTGGYLPQETLMILKTRLETSQQVKLSEYRQWKILRIWCN